MKRLILLTALAVAYALQLNAQEAFYIYRNDGQFNAFFHEEVDSIVYSNIDLDSLLHDEYVVQEVYTEDSIYRIPLVEIDSVEFDVNDIIISPDFIFMNEYTYQVIEANNLTGDFVLRFISNDLPNFHNDGLLVIETDTMMYLRRIQSFEIQEKNVFLFTSQAFLNDVFLKGSFRLSTIPLESRLSSRVYYPTEIMFIDSFGKTNKIRYKELTQKVDLFQKTIDYSNKTLWKNTWAELYVEKCTYDFNLGFIATCNFNSKKDIYEKYRKGELAITEAVLKGSVNTNFMLRLDMKKECEKEFKEETLKENIHKAFWANFLINGVPVGVQLTTHLMADGGFHANANLSAYSGYTANAQASLGVSWSQNKGIKPIHKFESGYTFLPPTIEGDAHFDGKISIYPRINFAIYGISGPTFDIKPYGKVTADLGFLDNLYESTKKDFYGTEFNFNIGYDGAVGLNFLPYFGSNLWLYFPPFNVIDKNIHKTPYKIICKEEQGKKIKEGESITATFQVKDYDVFSIENECNTWFPLVVKFTTNSGNIENDFSIVDIKTGNVSIKWTPSSHLSSGTRPRLNAYLYNSNGIPILGETWFIEIENKQYNIPVSITKTEVVDALYYPSHFDYKGEKYDLKYTAAIYVKLTDDTGVEDWGYEYMDNNGQWSEPISLAGYGRNSIKVKSDFYRNADGTDLIVRPYVTYNGERCNGEEQTLKLNYPNNGSKITLTDCTFMGTEEEVEYHGQIYKYKSTFRFDFTAEGAFWLKVGTEEIDDEDSGWKNWDNDLVHEMKPCADGTNAYTVNYYYNQKEFEGEYKVRLRGADFTHNKEYHTDEYVTYTYKDNQFTGCTLHK